MASIADVLRHLVKHAPDLYPEGRQEFLDAIGAAPELATDHAAGRAQPEQPEQPAQPEQPGQ